MHKQGIKRTMATVDYPLQTDASKEAKDLENANSQMRLEQSQSETPEIDPSNSTVNDIQIVNNDNDSPIVNEISESISILNNDVNSDDRNDKNCGAESRKLISTEEHPLQISIDDETVNIELGIEADEEIANKKNRHVFFPEDGRIVSGYMEPPKPWNDASTCSTEELIEAYKNACDRFGVKPLPRLMQQLNVINDFSERNETLTLKGERLDSKHCETLEEILRRVQFRTFDLENTHLDDEGTVALFDMIEHYESCNRLNISNNRTIGVRGWQACARLMKKTPCLENLEARNCVISEQVMPFFCRSLKIGSCLTVLHLENSIMSGRHLIVITQALKMNDILQELYLADNKLMPSDGIQLGNLLRYNIRLQLLDVRNNHLQDVGTSHICDGIWEQNLGHGLATIVMWNNQVTYQAMNSLSRALANTKSLETLNLGHNNITNEGIHRLKDGLLHNKSLLRIGLQASKISCEGAVALAEFIAESPRLRRIDLRENDIKTGGLMGLSLSLKVSESVTRIDLDKEPKREASMKDYAEQQRRLLNDINNYMQRNRDSARMREEEEQRRLQEEENAKTDEVQNITAPLSNNNIELPAESDQNEKTDSTKDDKETKVEEESIIEPDNVHPERPQCLDLAGAIGPHTLDSPAFISEDKIPLFSTSLYTQRPGAFAQPVSSPKEVPLFFPPSPMISDNGRPTLAPMLGAAMTVISPEGPLPAAPMRPRSKSNELRVTIPTEVFRKSPSSSPTFKRKFVISRVQEPSKKHDAAVSDKEAVDMGDTGDTSDTGDCLSGTDPIITVLGDALAEVARLTGMSEDVNNDDNPSAQDSVITTSPCTQSAVSDVKSVSTAEKTGVGTGDCNMLDTGSVSEKNIIEPHSAQPAVCSTHKGSSHSDEQNPNSAIPHTSDILETTTDNDTKLIANSTTNTTKSTVDESIVNYDIPRVTLDVPETETSSKQMDSSVEVEHSSPAGPASHIDRDCAKGVSEISCMNGVVQNVINVNQAGVSATDVDLELCDTPQQESVCTNTEFEKELDSILAEVSSPGVS